MRKGKIFKMLTATIASACVLTAPIMLAGCDSAELEALNNKVTQLEQSNSTLGSQITDLEADITELETQKADLEAQVQQLERENELLEEDYNSSLGMLNEEIRILEEQIDFLKSGVPAFEVSEEDKSLVDGINAVLEENTTSADYIDTVVATLLDNEYETTDFVPEAENTYLYWVKEINKVVIANENDGVGYPIVKTTPKAHKWMALTRTLPEEPYIVKGSMAIVSTADQLYKLANDIYASPENKIEGSNIAIETIVLTEDLDMRGVDICFGDNGKTGAGAGGVLTVQPILTEIEIDGAGHKIYNLYADKDDTGSSKDGKEIYEKKNSGLFSTNHGTIIFKDFSVTDSVFGTPEIGDSAILVANNYASSTGSRGSLYLHNVVIDGCTLYGETKTGTVMGRCSEGSLVVTGQTTIKNTNVYTSAGEAGGVFGIWLESYAWRREAGVGVGNMNSVYTVENKEILIGENVNVEMIENPFEYVREIEVNAETLTGVINGDLVSKTGLYDEIEITVPSAKTYTTSWELEDGEPKGKQEKGYLVVRGTVAKYGFTGQTQYSTGAYLMDGEDYVVVEYDNDGDGTAEEYKAVLAYAVVAIEDYSDLELRWNDYFPDNPLATATDYINS